MPENPWRNPPSLEKPPRNPGENPLSHFFPQLEKPQRKPPGETPWTLLTNLDSNPDCNNDPEPDPNPNYNFPLLKLKGEPLHFK